MVEVLVIGAGPAGALAALMLARAGVRVLLVDRARFPRDKLCGDTLNPGAMRILQRWGLAGPVHAHGLRIDGMIVTSASGVRIRGAYGEGVCGRALTRRLLDSHLVDAAVAAGARFQDGVTVREVIMDDAETAPTVRGAVLTTNDGKVLRVPALMTIAADGRRSSTAFKLGLAQHPAWPRRWAVGAYFTDVPGGEAFGEMHIRDGHYVGVAPVPEGLTNVCYVSESWRGRRDPQKLLLERLAADPLLRDRFRGAHMAMAPVILGPLAVDVPRPGMPGLLLAGDAAGFIDPMTGDGLRFALRGAELAAEVALAALERPELPAVDELARRRRREFRRKHRLNRTLRTLVASPRAVRLAAAAASVAPGVLHRVIAFAGDVGAI